MIFPRHFVTTNRLGAETCFRKGLIVVHNGERWRITKLKPLKGSIHGSIFVYGIRLS